MASPCPDLDAFPFSDAEVRGLVEAGATAAAVTAARTRLEAAATAGALGPEPMCDAAGAILAHGDAPAAFGILQNALHRFPDHEGAFHATAVALYRTRELHGANHAGLLQLLAASSARNAWAQRYRGLLYLPTFMNVEFVSGKCNLKCRMCIGTNRAEHPDRLSFIEPDTFAAMLDGSPTTRRLTLSSGDSDPLLHPRFETILEIARARGVLLDLFTNGLPLTEKRCAAIVRSQTVAAINFSIDAATEATYARIRGGDFRRVLDNIAMLQAARRDGGAELPHLSLSFVAMRDNIEELPAFVEIGATLGATRVYVEGLIGWRGDDGGNFPATDHPQWRTFVAAAMSRGAASGIELQLPESLTSAPADDAADAPHAPDALAAPGGTTTAPPPADEPAPSTGCPWLSGVWVQRNGNLDPCCLVHDVADMGSIHDGPLHRNARYVRVKEELRRGKVFAACRGQRNCAYVEQQARDGIPLRIIDAVDLPARPAAPPLLQVTVGAAASG